MQADDLTSLDKVSCSQHTVVRQLADLPFPPGLGERFQKEGVRVECTKTERALLNYLVGKLDDTFIQNIADQ